MISRRSFCGALVGGAAEVSFHRVVQASRPTDVSLSPAVSITDIKPGEDIFTDMRRVTGVFDATLYRQILGAANAFKEGDQIVGVAAADETSRHNARTLLAGAEQTVHILNTFTAA